jgi:signal transduction histidine kinase
MSWGRISAALAAVGAAVGIAGEVASDAGLAASAADLATGWALLACGLWGLRQRPGQLRWLLLALAGITWFAGNFDHSDVAAVSAVGGALIYLHRGLLVHACVTATGLPGAVVAAGATAGYVDGLVTGSLTRAVTAAVGVLMAAFAAAAWMRRGALTRRSRGLVAASLLALAAGLLLAGVSGLAHVSASGPDSTLYAYEAALVASALLLAAVPGSESRAHAILADLVVEMGPARRSPTVRGALARALGDPSLQVGYWLGGGDRYVDLDGHPVELPAADSGRAATVVEHDGERLAVLVHDAGVLDDPALVASVQEAAGLVLANARLEAEVATQLGELRASRQRIVQARDEQRRRLAQRLREGAERRLGEVSEAVRRARAHVAGGGDAVQLLDLVDGELLHARDELRELARGIHPRVLTERGLAAALTTLGERAPVAVELTAPTQRLPAPMEAAAYFVCAEGLTNVAKYAQASRVRCEVVIDDARLRVVVVDDGVGGANSVNGSGLRGLADRVEALGGRFQVASPPGEGTTIRAELPLPGPR